MEDFESYLLLKGLSPTTIRDTLGRAKKIIPEIGEITQENVTSYILKQKHDGRLNNGINIDIKVIKHYLKYLKLDTKIACFLLPESQSDREILSDGEIAEFLAVQRPTDGILNWGVYWLLTIYCGLRCGETARLQVGDIDFGAKVINLKRSKTGRLMCGSGLSRQILPHHHESIIERVLSP